MNFDWQDYLHLANRLAEFDKKSRIVKEAKLRAAISRAYYAAFNKAKNYLYSQNKDVKFPTDGSVHDYVQQQFQQNSDKIKKKIGGDLYNLRKHRNKADYADSIRNLEENTKLCLIIAKDIISKIEKL